MAETAQSHIAEGAASSSPLPQTSPAQKSTRAASVESGDLHDPRPGKKRKFDMPPLTAAAAQTEARARLRETPSTDTSPNPQLQVLNTLMGSTNDMSKAQTSNPATTMSAPMAEVVANIQHHDSASGESALQTSPVSMSSMGTLESLPGQSGMTTTVGSPLPMDDTGKQASVTDDASVSPEDANKAFTFPPPLLQPQADGRRGMSLPQANTRQGTRSPSAKKHRCPYCATEFTRHHNLKSHLLTHSQEKPYVCSTCQSRFRRLHDLKRHTKLHTGERPHICPKCGRKFARGDALARHNKGPGGCAGRRASMGSFGGDDDMDVGDDSMDGVMYNEPDAMDEDDSSLPRPPSIRRQAPSGDDTVDDPEHSSRMPSTYPPIQGRPPGGMASGSYPPRGFAPSGSGSSGPGPGVAPLPFPGSNAGSTRHGGPGGVFAQNPLTESPKPLSPGQSQRGSIAGGADRHRSPSMTHFQHGTQSYPRSGPGSGSSLSVPPNANSQLPPPPGLNPPDSRYTLPSQVGPTHPQTGPTGPPTHLGGSGPLSSHSNSLSSHGQSAHGSGENSSPMYAKEDRLWAVIKNLESRVNGMQDEINSLRSQLAAATGSQSQQQARAA